MDGSPLFDKYEIPLLNKSNFQSDKSIRNNLYKATKLFILDNHIQSTPNSRIGNIGTGDKFINEQQDAKSIADIDNILCVEMEGAAVAQVCYEHGIPFGIVRIISDESNSDAHIDFQEFIKSTATVYSLGIIKNYLTYRLTK
jgi:adenosylhomocysteine nucleosidase